jgi:hypothetical protein
VICNGDMPEEWKSDQLDGQLNWIAVGGKSK